MIRYFRFESTLNVSFWNWLQLVDQSCIISINELSGRSLSFLIKVKNLLSQDSKGFFLSQYYFVTVKYLRTAVTFCHVNWTCHVICFRTWYYYISSFVQSGNKISLSEGSIKSNSRQEIVLKSLLRLNMIPRNYRGYKLDINQLTRLRRD